MDMKEIRLKQLEEINKKLGVETDPKKRLDLEMQGRFVAGIIEGNPDKYL